MRYIECPQAYDGQGISLFMAGGISNCPLWQQDLVELLADTELVLLNPRRKHYPTDNPFIEEEQIGWEHKKLKQASASSFWFPKETLCPITLYELGKQSGLSKPLFIGLHPEYSRRRDVEIQTKLQRPEIEITYSLEDLASQIKRWTKKL